MTTTKKTKRARITKEEYDRIKLFIEAGADLNAIAKITKRSYSTICRISASEDIEGYHKHMRDTYDRYIEKHGKGKAPETSEAVTGGSTEDTEALSEEVSTGSTYAPESQLERIATALERLAEAWEAQPKRTGLFK